MANIKDRFLEIIDELVNLRMKKNSDYANKEDPNRNFKSVAAMAEPLFTCQKCGCTTVKKEFLPMVIAMIYGFKQVDGVIEMISKGKIGKAESILDKLNDIAVYSIIERMIYEEVNKQ